MQWLLLCSFAASLIDQACVTALQVRTLAADTKELIHAISYASAVLCIMHQLYCFNLAGDIYHAPAAP